MYSAKYLSNPFIDPDKIIKCNDHCYRAVLDSTASFFDVIDFVRTLSQQCKTPPKIQMQFKKHTIHLQVSEDSGNFSVEIPAAVTKEMPKPFYYNYRDFENLLKTIKGQVCIDINASGMMFAFDSLNQYVASNTRTNIKKSTKKNVKNKAA